jgi:hypothetical protein
VAIGQSVGGALRWIDFEQEVVWDIYIWKHVIRKFENEIKPTWRDRLILNRDSCNHVSRVRAYSKPQTVGSGSVPLGRCQVVKRRVGSHARVRTIHPTAACGESPGTSILLNGAKNIARGRGRLFSQGSMYVAHRRLL